MSSMPAYFLQVKFDVGLAADKVRVAEKSERVAICYDSPEFLTPVQIFLD